MNEGRFDYLKNVLPRFYFYWSIFAIFAVYRPPYGNGGMLETLPIYHKAWARSFRDNARSFVRGSSLKRSLSGLSLPGFPLVSVPRRLQFQRS